MTSDPGRRSGYEVRVKPRTLVLLLCGVLVVAAAGLTVVPGVPRSPESPVVATPVPVAAAASSTVAAIEVLRAWDERRSRAWARGDVRALRRLYTPRSRSGRVDRAALSSYADRGLRVTGLRTQLLAVEVERQTGRLLVLRATDRMTRAVARGQGRSVVLPRDEPSSWRLVLRRAAGEWRMAGVRRVPRPGPR